MQHNYWIKANFLQQPKDLLKKSLFGLARIFHLCLNKVEEVKASSKNRISSAKKELFS